MLLQEGRRRVQIEGVSPEIDGGRFPIKRTVGEEVRVEVDMFADGHDAIAGVVQYRAESSGEWSEVPLSALVNDRWQATFTVSQMGRYLYTISSWVDHFLTWRKGIAKKIDAGQDVAVDVLIGAQFVEEASQRATGDDSERLKTWAATLRSIQKEDAAILEPKLLSEDLAALMAKYPDRRFATTYEKELGIVVDREKARFSSWYEMFPRSCGEPGKHGTFKRCSSPTALYCRPGF
jgi:starch synthase (maltosyl-transferring)